jgi:putative DNA primase/helicase
MERLDTRHRWLDILTGLGVPAKFLRNKHGPCPMCGGKDRFRFDDKDGKGTFFCNGCGAQPMLMVAQARHAVGLASAFVISFILSLATGLSFMGT